MNELKPCPFCGSTDHHHIASVLNGRSQVHCEYCGSEGPVCESEASAIAAWNRRTPAPANVCPLPKVQCSGEEAPVGTFTCPPSCRAKEVEK